MSEDRILDTVVEILYDCQEEWCRLFKNVVETGKISGAYLILGPDDALKTYVALSFAKSFECGVWGGCGICENCSRQNHPDILILKKDEGSERIKVSLVRETISFSKTPPILGRRKFILIKEAHLLTLQSWSAFLKIAEDYPPQTTFIFITSKPSYVPLTIRSRCSLVYVRFPEDRIHKLYDLLSKNFAVEKEFFYVSENLPMPFDIVEKALLTDNKDIIKELKESVKSFLTGNFEKFLDFVGHDRDRARMFFKLLQHYLFGILSRTEKYEKVIQIWDFCVKNQRDIELMIDPVLAFGGNMSSVRIS